MSNKELHKAILSIKTISNSDKTLLEEILLKSGPRNKKKTGGKKTRKMQKGGDWCNDSNKCLLFLALLAMVVSGVFLAKDYIENTYGEDVFSQLQSLSEDDEFNSMLDPRPVIHETVNMSSSGNQGPSFGSIASGLHDYYPSVGGVGGFLPKIMNLINLIRSAPGEGCKKIMSKKLYGILDNICEKKGRYVVLDEEDVSEKSESSKSSKSSESEKSSKIIPTKRVTMKSTKYTKPLNLFFHKNRPQLGDLIITILTSLPKKT
jgi:hypothetical protein